MFPNIPSDGLFSFASALQIRVLTEKNQPSMIHFMCPFHVWAEMAGKKKTKILATELSAITATYQKYASYWPREAFFSNKTSQIFLV